ncbi:MAG: hypothetical protein ABSG53_06865 [Thermoguttaceae bacterium]
MSNLFKDSTALNACLVSDSAHVTPGAVGDHVHRIQVALLDLDGLSIDTSELAANRYGPSTAASVLAYKRKRKIINRAYQNAEDNIVGKMTIATLDKEMFERQYTPGPSGSKVCTLMSGGAAARPRRRHAQP